MKLIIKDNYADVSLWAAQHIANAINNHKEDRPFVLGLPTGSSPLGVYKNLIEMNKAGLVTFKNVVTFNMDEYVGLPKDHDQSYWYFMHDNFFNHIDIPRETINILDGMAEDLEAECARYAELLKKYPTDIVVMGIGENGHIAFNDPPVADFNDEKMVKPVVLDEICRNQQVNDGCFAKIDDVPKMAITLTVPTLFAGDYLFCIVPAATKARAVRDTLCGEIGEACPATVLRRHKNAVLYLDGDSSSWL